MDSSPGILLAFERATGLNALYRIDIDDRRFEFAVQGERLANAQGQPAVTVTATAADLITARLGSTAAERKAALKRVQFDGNRDAVDARQSAFRLSGDPGMVGAA